MANTPDDKNKLSPEYESWFQDIAPLPKTVEDTPEDAPEEMPEAPPKRPAPRTTEGGKRSPKEIEKRKEQRRRARKLRRIFVMLGSVVVILLLAWGITAIIGAIKPRPEPEPSQTLPKNAPVISSISGLTPLPLPPTPDNTAWNFPGLAEQTINLMGLIAPDYRILSLPENGRVDMSYFNTVTFVGDSLTQGFQIYSQGIPNAHYCAYKGIGPKQIYDGSIQRRQDGEQEIPLDALVASAPANVYIQLGANAMVSLDDASILAYYKEMLGTLRGVLPPETGYYIQSLTPVRPDNDPGFDLARIGGLNNLLAKMAFEEKLYFLDLTEPLAGDDGYLREDYAGGDGYHLKPVGYAAWADYLVTHTAYRPGTPYLEGSPFYAPAPPPAPEPPPPASVAVDPAAVPPVDPAAVPPVAPAAVPPVDPAAVPPADPAAVPSAAPAATPA